MGSREMEVAIVTSLATKWNMYVDACH